MPTPYCDIGQLRTKYFVYSPETNDAAVFSMQFPRLYGHKAEFSKINTLTTFETFTVLKFHVVLVWIMTQICNLVATCLNFKGIHCLYLQNQFLR